MPDLAAQRGQTVEGSRIRIRHYGFAGPKRAEKFLRDVKLLDLELQERPGQLYYQIELYRTLLLLGDNRWRTVLRDAIDNLLKHINSESSPISPVALLLETLLQLPEKELPTGLSHVQLRELADKWFPRSAPLIWVLAKQEYERELFESAEMRLRQLIEMGKNHSYDKSVGFDPRILGGEAELNLAACLIRQAKLKEAEQILESLAARQEYHHSAEQNLSAIKRIRLGLSKKTRRKRRR